MWEMRIIQEFCELGSVTHCLHKGLLPGQTGSRTPPELKTSLQLSKDVACGMLHIHSMQVCIANHSPRTHTAVAMPRLGDDMLPRPSQIIHSDLKSGNVLLVESRRGDASSVAKVRPGHLSCNMSSTCFPIFCERYVCRPSDCRLWAVGQDG